MSTNDVSLTDWHLGFHISLVYLSFFSKIFVSSCRLYLLTAFLMLSQNCAEFVLLLLLTRNFSD